MALKFWTFSFWNLLLRTLTYLACRIGLFGAGVPPGRRIPPPQIISGETHFLRGESDYSWYDYCVSWHHFLRFFTFYTRYKDPLFFFRQLRTSLFATVSYFTNLKTNAPLSRSDPIHNLVKTLFNRDGFLSHFLVF